MIHELLCKLETTCRPNFEEQIIVHLKLGTSLVVFDTILHTHSYCRPSFIRISVASSDFYIVFRPWEEQKSCVIAEIEIVQKSWQNCTFGIHLVNQTGPYRMAINLPMTFYHG